MKKIIKSFAILAAILAMAACTKEAEDSPVSSSRELTVTATREGVSLDTKTIRMNDGSTWWNASEEISLFYGSGTDGGDKFTSQNTTPQKIVEFGGSVKMTGSDKDFWAVYPYSQDNSCDGSSITTVIPAVQIGSESNFSGNVFPVMAKTSTNVFAFLNICGGVKFSVSRSDIKSVTFKGNGGEVLAGKVRVSFNADGTPDVVEVLDGKTEVTLNAPDGGTFKDGKYYYLTLLPTLLDGGFTMTFNTATEAGSVMSNNAQTVKRSIFGVLKDIDSKVSEWEGTLAEPEWVDLGLSVKWATFNVGATKPEEYGDYFAWGETEPKENYDWSTYKWCNGSSSSLTKYNTAPIDGTVDNKIVLELQDDAAHVNWSGGWRMPTKAEWDELFDNCTCTWTGNYNGTGVAGRIVFSNMTGYTDKYIFLPAAGSRNGYSLIFAGFSGFCWSSSIWPDEPKYDHGLSVIQSPFRVDFTSGGGAFLDNGSRIDGLSVRPVYADRAYPASIILNKSTLSLQVGDSELLTAMILPEHADKTLIWSSDNAEVAGVDEAGNVTALKVGTATITAMTTLGGKTATCKVAVTDPNKGDEYVDLGLSVKWASWNVGAFAPEDYGDYFAWGETEPNGNYNWPTYKWGNGGDLHSYGSNLKINKYCTNGAYWDGSAPMDNKIALDLEDDASHVNWGGSWRMPTDSEWTELRENCTWTWSSDYNRTGVAGHIVFSNMTGYTDKYIFLPAAGYRSSKNLYDAGSYGYYWSSSLYTDSFYDCEHAFNFEFQHYFYGAQESYRYVGLSVRPVTE